MRINLPLTIFDGILCNPKLVAVVYCYDTAREEGYLDMYTNNPYVATKSLPSLLSPIMLKEGSYELIDLTTAATPKKAHMKANSYVTSSALKKVFQAPALQGLTPEQVIHHPGPVYVASLKQTDSLHYLLGVLNNWDQTHGIVNKVSGATNEKHPNIKVTFLKMPDLLAEYKAKYDKALQRYNAANAAKVKAAKRKRMT
eukprot:11400244-Ditylum_brightwellii.AAC.1